MHGLTEEGDWATAFGPGGALEALIAAREQGQVRFIGSPAMG